jgi:hypothetical protein
MHTSLTQGEKALSEGRGENKMGKTPFNIPHPGLLPLEKGPRVSVSKG